MFVGNVHCGHTNSQFLECLYQGYIITEYMDGACHSKAQGLFIFS